MGQLTKLLLPTTKIKTAGGDLNVRGLAFADFWILAQEHGPEATMLFSKIVNNEKVGETEIKTLFTGLLPQVPNLVAAVIALALDDYNPEGLDVARRLPPQVQLDVLEAAFVLTIQSEAELKKFMESIIRMLSGATNLAQQMRLPLSDDGFGVSVAK